MGAPRFMVETANEFNAHTAFIKKEDIDRANDIRRRRDKKDEASELKAREIAFREYEKNEAERKRREMEEEETAREKRRVLEERQLSTTRDTKRTPAQWRQLRATQQRLNELAVPKQYPEAAYGGKMYGRCMYQRTRRVEFPVGRNGACYCPGVDRDRIVPERPDLEHTTPPWIGSFQTHLAEDSEKTHIRREESYYLEPSRRTAADRSLRATALQNMAQRHLPQQQHGGDGEDGDEMSRERVELLYRGQAGDAARRGAEDDDDDGAEVASIFSHGSSNGPIVATGAQHMDAYSTKDEVRAHLAKYGGAMTGPRRDKPCAPYTDLTLPELSKRLMKMQLAPPKLPS